MNRFLQRFEACTTESYISQVSSIIEDADKFLSAPVNKTPIDPLKIVAFHSFFPRDLVSAVFPKIKAIQASKNEGGDEAWQWELLSVICLEAVTKMLWVTERLLMSVPEALPAMNRLATLPQWLSITSDYLKMTSRFSNQFLEDDLFPLLRGLFDPASRPEPLRGEKSPDLGQQLRDTLKYLETNNNCSEIDCLALMAILLAARVQLDVKEKSLVLAGLYKNETLHVVANSKIISAWISAPTAGECNQMASLLEKDVGRSLFAILFEDLKLCLGEDHNLILSLSRIHSRNVQKMSNEFVRLLDDRPKVFICPPSEDEISGKLLRCEADLKSFPRRRRSQRGSFACDQRRKDCFWLVDGGRGSSDPLRPGSIRL